MKTSLRRLWLKLHRWTALGLGWLLGLAALLGALLSVAKPLDRWAHPEFFMEQTSPAPAHASPLEPALRQLRAEFGPQAGFTFRPPRTEQDTLWVYVRGPWDGTIYFDAAGQERGRRDEHEGFYNLLFELHSSLLLGDPGKAVLTGAALSYLLLLVTGLVLWWPARWPPVLKIRLTGGWRKWVFDLHNVGGAVLGVFIAVSVATGAYMAWPPLRTLVSSAFAEVPFKAPTLTADASAKTWLPLDEVVARANAVYPGAMVGYVQVSPAQPVRVRLKLAEDPHPNGLTSVWLHPSTGTVLATKRFDQLDTGLRIVSVVYPLHTGELGGLALTIIVGLGGMVLAMLSVTGLVLWWTRRQSRKKAIAWTGSRVTEQ
ncbi:PepSY-associated TM helix domain-containing protein [Acidovorax sp.]|uniref:PepSY-associated TM helix domain-containing protein n=1 Tax=Acidovorax sp. TaxID=1872122 RepID=UPI003BB1B7AE